MSKSAKIKSKEPAGGENWAPRRQPNQQRARATVDAILEAAEKVIQRKGYADTTTNHIAAVAGVSVGSLYQYFPRKEAIVAAMLENAVVSAGDVLRERLLSRMEMPLEAGVPELIRMILETRRAHSFVFFGLPREVPDLRVISHQLTIESFLSTTISAYFMQHREQIKVPDLHTAMIMCTHLVVGSINTYLDGPSPELGVDDFVAQLSDALLKYMMK